MKVAGTVLLLAFAVPAQRGVPSGHHSFVYADQLKWSAGLLPNLETAVVSGDPKTSRPFVIRIRAVSDQLMPAHWHPLDEHVTAIKGDAAIGTGDKFDKRSLRPLKPGDYVLLPKETRHFAWFPKGAEVQVHGDGPFVVNWVNPDEVLAMKKNNQVDSNSERAKLKEEQDKR